ncbi:MAG: hypothetical protein KF746_19235 [Chitinophagaceae bacterium]|nr:hypothetical protein [Chitinophagaceae bacterium]
MLPGPYHFSIHKGAGVDLVLEDRRKQPYGIEIKSTAPVNNNHFKGLKRLTEVTGKKFQRGIVLYSGEQVVGGFEENMQAIPISAPYGHKMPDKGIARLRTPYTVILLYLFRYSMGVSPVSFLNRSRNAFVSV